MLGVHLKTTQAADENRHLGRRQRQQLRPIHQQFLSGPELLAAKIVAEAVSGLFERREGVRVGLRLRRVHAPRHEGDFHIVAGVLRGFLDRSTTAEHDQIGK